VSNSLDSFKCRKILSVNGKDHVYFDLKEAEKNGLAGVSRLPFSMKVLLENLLRNEDGRSVTKEHRGRRRVARRQGHGRRRDRLSPGPRADAGLHRRSRVVDLAAMRDAMARSSAATRRRSTRWCPSTSSSTTR
jgi:aconitate hydratase